MISTENIRFGVGIIGNIIAFCLFLSPVPTFIKIAKKKTVDQYSPIPYLCTFFNCMLWVLYGLPIVHPNSILVVTINGAGVFIEIVYLILFLIYSDKKKRMQMMAVTVVEVVFVAVLGVAILSLVPKPSVTTLRATIVGSVCMVGNIMMYASPLSVMKMVITTKSVEYMPLSLSVASFANGICWTAYGCIHFDPFIVAPNGIGSLFGLAQLILYAAYYKSTKIQMDEKQGAGEVSMAEKGMSGGPKKLNVGQQNSRVR